MKGHLAWVGCEKTGQEMSRKSEMVDRFKNPMVLSPAHVGWSGMPTPRSRL